MVLRKKKVLKQKLTKEEERELMQHRRCINCAYAYLMQDEYKNPIIAICPKKNNDREVARMFVCTDKGYFQERIGEPIIHPMIYLKNKNCI